MRKCLMMLGILALVWASHMQRGFSQAGDPCGRCVTVLESKLACPRDVSGNLNWSLVVRNDSDFVVSYAFIVQGPSNVQVSPNPYIFDPPLQPGEVRKLNLVISGSYLGQRQLCFDIVFYNASLNRCCRVQTCVDLPQCCFFITESAITCEPHTGDFLYTFTLFNQFPAIVQYVVVVSQTPGVSVQPSVTVLNPPISYLGQATVTVRIRGAQTGQRVRLAIGLLNFLGGLCCSEEIEIEMPPCCFEISDVRTDCTDEGVFHEFTLTNWYPADICNIVMFPQTPGVIVSPNPYSFNPPLGYGQSRRVRLRIDTPFGCQGGQVCLQMVLLDCQFRMCCSKSACFETGQNIVSKLWTTTRDFEEGERDNIDISNDEIKLLREQTFDYPWVWVTNNPFGTISKIDARTHKEVARYYGPPGMTNQYGLGLVSRTTVDRFGNVWVECRGNDSVIQILDERNWSLAFDYNGNGRLDTSRDLNGDGCIQPNEMLPFGQDELVARYYKFPRGWFPRALAIDLNGYLWVGFSNARRVVQVDPNLPPAIFGPHVGGGTPPFLEDLQFPVSPYGFVATRGGYLYSATPGSTMVVEWCPGNPEVPNDARITQVVSARDGDRAISTYGIAAGSDCTIWVSDISNGRLMRWRPRQGQAGVSISTQGIGQSRGVNIDFDGNVWTSATGSATIAVWDPDTLTPTPFTDPCPTENRNHSGIGIALGNQIVNPGYLSNNGVSFWTYNGATVTLAGCTICDGIAPYNYNDFTGALLRLATQEGTWRAVYDGGCDDRIWGRLNWNAFIPEGTSVVVRVRAGNSLPIAEEFITVGNGEEFCIRGRYLEVEVRLSRTPRRVNECSYELCGQEEEFVTPIVYDLRAVSRCDCGAQRLHEVRGRVLADTETDGVPGAGDRPLSGWAVTIEDVNGNRLTRYTNSEGEYLFRNIPNGEYRLIQVTPPGWLPINPVGGQTEIQVNSSSVHVDFVNRLIGDIDGTLCVDDADLLAVLMAFGATGEGLPEDVTMDGVVDDADLLLVLLHFGIGC